MAFPVEGKTALVTGGGSGICLEFTRLLLSSGCNVLIADLRLTPQAEELMSSYTANGDGAVKSANLFFHKTDVTDWMQLQAAFDTCMTEFGGLDIVCPGAGVFEPPWSNFWHLKDTVDTIDTNSYKTLELNLTHPIRAAQLAIDYFKRQKHNHGAVILISSIAAQGVVFSSPMYGASKAAISSFTRSLGSLEPKIGFRVNAVAPGIVKTPLWTEDKIKWAKENDEWVTAEEVAKAMFDLIEEEFVGGTVLEVGVGQTRKVRLRNDPGPSKDVKGFRLSGASTSVEDVLGVIEDNFGK